jgi:hypothetical protein
VLKALGSSNGRRPAATPAAKPRAIADPADVVDEHGAGVASVDPAAVAPDESAVSVVDGIPLFAPVAL